MNRKRAFTKKLHGAIVNKRLFLVLSAISFFIAASASVYAIDADGDWQHIPVDCNDNDYYTFDGALNIPFDGIANDCYLIWDSELYDINDTAPPSNNGTYFKGDTFTLIGDGFRENTNFDVVILDSENRTLKTNNKITDVNYDDFIFWNTVSVDSSRKINETVLIPDLDKHPIGVYTIYVWFTASTGGGPGLEEWIPVDTFTVVEAPLRLTIASPLDGEIYYTGGSFTGSVNLQVSANKLTDTWWYSLDGAANKTFTPNTTITNIPLGFHTITAYANDTEGNISSKQSSFELWYTASDKDGDGQERPMDCNDNIYYVFTGAVNIPYDGLWNDCQLMDYDSVLYDINDASAPSNNATYYFGETVTLTGNYFLPNVDIRVGIADAENRTECNDGSDKITDINTEDLVWQGLISINSTRGFSKTIPLTDNLDHGLGIYTVYIWFESITGGIGNREYIPVDTFTVVEAPLRLTVASPLDGGTYYTGGFFTGGVNLDVSANKPTDSWWYSLDGALNKTFTPNTTITNLNLGSHTVTVYANDTLGNISSKQSSFELWYTASDKDGDGQDTDGNPPDCDDTNYYRFTGAVNIPYDGIWNDCVIRGEDSWLKDINDSNSPSNNSKYYLGDTVTITGGVFKQNYGIRITVVDAENGTQYNEPNTNKISHFDTYDIVWQNWLTTNTTGGFSQTITLTDNPDHGLGVYTVYIWFEAYVGGIGNREWIPIDTFTVVEAPLRLTVASPLDGETYYTGGFFTGSVNLDVSANKPTDSWWYSLDGALNKTFTPNTTITNLPLGSHTVTVYANDTEGNISSKQSSFELWYTASDNDGDGQDADGEYPNMDCDENNYYVFIGALNIPFDGSPNGCLLPGDSELYDSNDNSPPSVNSTYYKGGDITLLGNTFHKNSNVMVAILDSENRTSVMSGKIWLINEDDKVFMDYISTDDSRNLNKTILLPDLAKHPIGIYTIYVYFTDSLGDNGEWIPVDTFTVAENHAPNATIENITGYENTNIIFNISTTDSDGDPLTYSSDNLDVVWNGTHLYYPTTYDTVIHPNLTKTIAVNITADDGLLTYTQEVNVTILDVNRIPLLTPIGSRLINENELLSFNLSATDIESDPLTFDAQPLPTGAILTVNTFTWTPGAAQAGIYYINFSVTDGIGTVNETVQVTVVDIPGDFSGDGTTDSWDITYLARSITGIPGYESLSSGDVSGDDVVDAWDCTYMARAIAGVPGYGL